MRVAIDKAILVREGMVNYSTHIGELGNRLCEVTG